MAALDFNRFIDRFLHRESRPKTVGRYYPSEIGSCLRKVWFSYKIPKETEVDLIKVFEVGNRLHDFVAEVLKSEKNPEVELLKSEFPFRVDMKDFLISGRVDDLLLIKENGKEVLVEVKSTRSIDVLKEPQNQHVMQLQFYMHALDVHNGMLLYIEKSNLQSKVFEFEYDKKTAETALERFKALHEFLTKNKIPRPEAKEDGRIWFCKYCDYREECDNVEANNI